MPPVLEWTERSEEGHQNWLWQRSWRQDAGRVRLPGKDRWRADTLYCTWSRNVNDDRSTCGLEPSPVSSGRTMTGMCVQIITTLAPLSWLLLLYLSHQVPDDQRIETKMQSDKPNTELFIFSLKVNPFLCWQQLKKKHHFDSALLQTWKKIIHYFNSHNFALHKTVFVYLARNSKHAQEYTRESSPPFPHLYHYYSPLL